MRLEALEKRAYEVVAGRGWWAGAPGWGCGRRCAGSGRRSPPLGVHFLPSEAESGAPEEGRERMGWKSGSSPDTFRKCDRPVAQAATDDPDV